MFKTIKSKPKKSITVKLRGTLSPQVESKSNIFLEEEIERYNKDLANNTDYFDDGTVLQIFESNTNVFTVRDRVNNIIEDIATRVPRAVGGVENV